MDDGLRRRTWASLRHMKLAWAAILACAPGLLGSGAQPPQEVAQIESLDGKGEIELDPESGEAFAIQGVVLRYRGSTVSARSLRWDREAGLVEAQGDVRIESGVGGGSEAWRGDKASYDFNRRVLVAENFRLGQRPFFASGQRIEGNVATNRFLALDAFVTTDDVAEPAYRIRARQIEVRPGEFIEARNATLLVGNTRVLTLPYYRKNLRPHTRFWTVAPGYRSIFGPFSLNRYHWQVSTNAELTLDADWRLKRGAAGGPGIAYDLGPWGKGSASGYFAHDLDPFRTAGGTPVDQDRRLLRFQHSFTNETGLTIKGRVEEQNDALVYRDFFETDFRGDPQPKTLGEINQAWPNWTLDLLVQPRLNEFFQAIERLPDVKLTGLRQEVGVTGLYYDSESSFAYLRFQPGMLGGTTYAGARGDTYHQLLLPKTLFGWLNASPRLGMRLSYYAEPEDLPRIARDQVRSIANTGMELNAKASRTWTQSQFKPLDIDGLRHIVEPGLNYVFVPNPSLHPGEIPQFDYEWVTPRLLPIDFPDYNAIDSIDSQNVIRWSLRNRLQTKRADGLADVVNWALYTDWRLHPRDNQTTFAELYSDMDLAPTRWVTFHSQVRYGINQTSWREANHRMTLRPGERWAWTLGHRYLPTDLNAYGLGNNLVFSSFFYRFNENWAARATQQFEARDGVLEEHSYMLYRDLRSWTAALGVRIRDNRQGADDWSVVLTFQFKAFPRIRLGEDADRGAGRLFGG